MTLIDFLLLLLIAGVCGAIGQSLAGSSRGGCLAAIALGFIGALIGRALANALDLPEIIELEVGGKAFPVVWSVAGAAIFVAVLSLLTRGRSTGRHDRKKK